jgi:hypothetical protein
MPRIFAKISAKFRYRKSFFPTTHTLCFSTEHIILKLLSFSKLYMNFAVQNFGKVSQNIREIAKFHIFPNIPIKYETQYTIKCSEKEPGDLH